MTADPRLFKAHLAAYIAAAIALGIIALLVGRLDHLGTPGLHTIMEVIAASFAAMIGVIALVRYQSRNDLPYLFIGTGFLGTAVFDAFHAWATSVYAFHLFPSELTALSMWTWNAGRIFLGIMLALSGWAWWWGTRAEEPVPVRAAHVYIVSAVFLLVVTAIFYLVALPAPIYPQHMISRPLEVVAGLLFLIGLVGFLVMGEWRAEPAEHWLVLSLIVGLAIQFLILPFSTTLWDAHFDVAHLLKIVSYGLVLTGLLISVHSLHQTVLREERRLADTNQLLEAEIDRRNRAEAGVADRKRLLESVFGSMSDGVVVANAQGRMTHANQAAEEITGIGLTDRPVSEWPQVYGSKRPDGTPMPADDIPMARALRGESTDGTLLYIHNPKRAGGVHISISGRPLRDAQGRITGGVTVFRDVTTEREIEEQLRRYTAELERRNLDLQDFATIVSHDLKEPLRKVLAFGERLEGRLGPEASPQALDYLRRMRQGADRMRNLIDDLLAYTRLQELHVERSVDLDEVAERAVQDLEERIKETGGTVAVGDLPHIDCDPLKMYQVLANLIGNALKYHRDDTPPRVTVSGRIEKGVCVLTVEDNGIGLDMKYKDRIFRPFHRLHTRSEYEGSGIGLAIVRKIVDHHNGRIEVESEPGRGTRFTLRLPIRQKTHEVHHIVE